MMMMVMTTLSLALLFPVAALASQGPCDKGQIYYDKGRFHRFCAEPCRPGYIESPSARECTKPCPINFYHGYPSRGYLAAATLKCVRPVRVISSDNSACPWYDKCGLTVRKGCSKCPEGFENHGCTCAHWDKDIDVEHYERKVVWRV